MSKFKITFNRHFFIFVACALIVFTLGVLSNQAWHTKQVQTAVANAKQQAITADRQRRQANAVKAEQASLKAECNKEVAYYNSLTVVQKKDKAVPACQAVTANF